MGNDKPTIEVGDKDNLLDVIDVCINAVKEGEFDKQLAEMRVPLPRSSGGQKQLRQSHVQ